MNLPPLTKKSISIGFNGIALFDEKDIEKSQIGYSKSANGTNLIGSEHGRWLENWIVIGREYSLGDPIFVDVNRPDFPVYTATHGEGKWSPELICTTYPAFIQIIQKLELLATGRENPTKMEENPITQEEYNEFIAFVTDKADLEDLSFWEIMIADEEAL